MQFLSKRDPESWINELHISRRGECPKCKYYYDRSGSPAPCKNCGRSLRYEIGWVLRDGVIKVKPEVLQQVIETYLPLGLFYSLENKIYTGVDNIDGNAWAEDFKTLHCCKKWLLRYL